MLEEGTKAPDFSLPDQTGKQRTLSEFKGSPVLIYFYPKDNTPGCTKQACGIRDAWSEFEKTGISVIGISGDSVKSHQKFSSSYNLPFPILADPDRSVIRAYKALGTKKMFGREYEGILRVSYLISADGIIIASYPNVKPEEHVDMILEDAKELI